MIPSCLKIRYVTLSAIHEKSISKYLHLCPNQCGLAIEVVIGLWRNDFFSEQFFYIILSVLHNDVTFK